MNPGQQIGAVSGQQLSSQQMGYWASQQNLSWQQIASPTQQPDPQQVGRLSGQQTCGQQMPSSSQQKSPGQHFGFCGQQQCLPSQHV
jgi:hypothetical protein